MGIQGKILLAIFVGVSSCATDRLHAQSAERSAAADAVSSLFNPGRAPAKRSMGLLQRSFLDLVEASQAHLQVALVVDGTDSMAKDLDGVRTSIASMVDDLRRYKGDKVSFGLVIYRDTGSPSGEIVIPLSQFTTSEKALRSAFEAIVPESGAPYFPELVDVGIHTALHQLNWSDDPDTTRWILVFGDAPPYDADFNEPQTGARRRFDTDLLIELARDKQVQINCVLCTSSGEQMAAYQGVLDRMREFMNRLASGTDGLMLDLSYPDIRSALVEASRTPRVETLAIRPISQQDIEVARSQLPADQVAGSQLVRLAVLPHEALDQLSFDPESPAVQIAAEIRYRLKQLPQLELISPVDVQRQMRRLKSAGIAQDQLVQSLAVQLGVDYVVWGTYQPKPSPAVQTAVFRKQDGLKVVEASFRPSNPDRGQEIVSGLAFQLVANSARLGEDSDLRRVLGRLTQEQKSTIEAPLADSPEVAGHLRAGLAALEQALEYPVGASEGILLLSHAERHLTAAIEIEVRNPLAHWLLSNCFYNQARGLVQQGQAGEAQARMEQFATSLKRAYRERDRAVGEYFRQELVADYMLLIRRDTVAAIPAYEAILKSPEAPSDSALRRHWMLAGIFSGDWQLPVDVIDAERARNHLVQILAGWPDSSEATFLRQALRWNDETQRTQFANVPRQNSPLAQDWSADEALNPAATR